MDFPATQMFVDEEADDEEKGDNDDENNAGTPLRTDKNIKIGIIITDLKTYPVFRGVNKIGRLDDCHIIIDHNTISKEHAEIEAGLGSKSTFISDLKSLNKTKLNDAVLRPGRMYQLRNGDTLRFGSVNAVFKVENIEEEKSKERITFVIPETPLPIAKEARPVISGTPDHSFDGSLTEADRSSDVSLIAGTQDTGNVGGNTSPILSGKTFPVKGSSQGVDAKGGGIEPSGMNKNPNISESDEENIFEMMTQESDIHDEETQKFPHPKTKIIIPTRFTMEKPESRSIEDLETQKFPGGDDKRCSINDLETQKFPGGKIESNSCSINDLETQKFPTETTDTRSASINDLETEKFPTETTDTRSASINDLETQRLEIANKNDEDSETDEEGIFEESSEGDDMFDAPTQVIKSPRKASKLPLRIDEKYEEKKAEDNIAKKNKAAEVRTITRSKTPDKDISIEKKDIPKLNDSIESKLNHMFDEVNESGVDEPTQMLTQHLENILECTQNHESEIHQREGGILIAEKRIRPVPESFNRIKTIFDDSDDENIIESGDIEINKASRESKKSFQVPRMLSTQEIFGDLPVVNFLSTSSTKKNQGIDESEKINKSKAETVNGSQSDSENRFNRSKRVALSTTRNKDASAKKVEVTNSKIEKPVKPITGNNLPIKKRGSSVVRDTSTVVDKTPTARISKTSGAENPKISKTKRPVSNPILVFPPQRPKSPTPVAPDENETSNKNMRSKRSRRIADKSTATHSVSKTETIPKQRLPKKLSNTSNETSEEEVIPTKKRRIIPKEQKKLENKNISESFDSGTNQNETLATRSRKGRNKVNTSSTANSSNSSLGIKSLADAVQSSLESQEIQAILGVAEETNKQTRVSRYRQELNSVRSQRPVITPKKYEEDDRPGFVGFAKSEILVKNCEDTFEEPVGIPNRKKRQPRGSQLNATKNKVQDTSNNRPKPRSKENKEVAKEISINETKNISADVETPTSRGAKRVTSRITTDRGEKENTVEETPRKRGRSKIKIAEVKSEEIKSSQLASPLRRGRSALATPPSAVPSSTRIKHKILFTGLNDARLISIIHNLGGMITEKPNDCTVLVTDKVRRTYKFLCAMAMAVPIVSVNWLDESEKNERFLDPGDFLLHDPVEEAKFSFNLRKSLAKATNNKLLEGYTVVLTPNTAPPPKAEMTGIIQACGGKTLARPPTKWPEKSLIISRQEDIVNAKKFLNKAPKGVHLLSVEFILTGILRHELNFKDHKLSIP